MKKIMIVALVMVVLSSVFLSKSIFRRDKKEKINSLKTGSIGHSRSFHPELMGYGIVAKKSAEICTTTIQTGISIKKECPVFSTRILHTPPRKLYFIFENDLNNKVSTVFSVNRQIFGKLQVGDLCKFFTNRNGWDVRVIRKSTHQN